MALWDSPRQREAYDWFTLELANLRTAFRWAADQATWTPPPPSPPMRRPSDLGRKLRADSLGRRAHRIRPRRRPSPARGPVRDGVAVLRPDGSMRRPLQRRRPDRSRQGRHDCHTASKAGSAVRTWPSASPNGGSSCAAPSCAAAATPMYSSGQAWSSHWRSPVRGEEAMVAADGLIEAAEAIAKPVCALVRAARLRLRFQRRRSRPRTGRPATGPGDRSRQRQPLQRVTPGGQSGPTRGRTRRHRWPRSTTSLWRSATSTTRATPPGCAAPWPSSPRSSTGSDATNRRPPSPVSRSVPSPQRRPRDQHRDRPPARCPRRPDLRIARPQGRDDDHRRHGDLRIRPNRPGPSRTERRLEIDHIRDVPDRHPRRRFCQVVASQKFVSEEPIAILRHSAHATYVSE